MMLGQRMTAFNTCRYHGTGTKGLKPRRLMAETVPLAVPNAVPM